jgi:hypothetical protein
VRCRHNEEVGIIVLVPTSAQSRPSAHIRRPHAAGLVPRRRGRRSAPPPALDLSTLSVAAGPRYVHPFCVTKLVRRNGGGPSRRSAASAGARRLIVGSWTTRVTWWPPCFVRSPVHAPDSAPVRSSRAPGCRFEAVSGPSRARCARGRIGTRPNHDHPRSRAGRHVRTMGLGKRHGRAG